MFQVRKGSKNTHLKGMDEFLQAEIEAGQTKDAEHGEEPVEERHRNAREARLRSVLDHSPLRLVRARKGYVESLKLFFQRGLQHLGWSPNYLMLTLRKMRMLASNYI